MARAVLALCVLILLAGCENPPHPVPPEPGSSGPIPGVIPWTPLTPNLTPPLPAQGPVPLPPGTPPCQAPDLAGVVIAKNGAGGHIFVSFRFAGVSRGACYLDGTPAIGLIDADGHAIAFRQLPPFGATPQAGPALIEPGPAPEPGLGLKVGQADLTIDWVTQPEACPAGFQAVLPTKAMVAIRPAEFSPFRCRRNRLPICARDLESALSRALTSLFSPARRRHCRPSRCRYRTPAEWGLRSLTW